MQDILLQNILFLPFLQNNFEMVCTVLRKTKFCANVDRLRTKIKILQQFASSTEYFELIQNFNLKEKKISLF